MRILWDIKEFNQKGENIEEIQSIDLVAGWDKEDAGKKMPTALFVMFDGEYEGCYQIDCDKKKFKEAKENYNEIIDSLLVKGYAKASWFKMIWS